MATVSSLARPAGGLGNSGRKPYLVEVEIDLAAAATAKGSALATNDVIECLNIGANQAVLFAGTEIITAPTGGTAGTFDLGITGGDVDMFVDGGAITSATAGTYATMVSTALPYVSATADTIDMLLLGTTPDTAGTIRVFACVIDLDGGLPAGADEVDRDQLA